MMNPEKSDVRSKDSEVWKRAIADGVKEVAVYDKDAVRRELKASRRRHTVRVKSVLP